MWRAGILVVLGALANVLITTWMIGLYWAVFDIGINQSANSLTLIFLWLPAITIGSLTIAGLVWWATRQWGALQRAAASLGGVALTGFLAFGIMLWQVRDYPTPEPQRIETFIRAVLGIFWQ